MSTTTGSTKGKRRLLDKLGDEVERYTEQVLVRHEGIAGEARAEIEITEEYELERAGDLAADGGVSAPLAAGILGEVGIELGRGWHAAGRGTVTVRMTLSARRGER